MIHERPVTLGRTSLSLLPLGVGTWQWGDTRYWQYGKSYTHQDVEAAFRASIEAGLTLFDTAEIYGNGASEQILGALARSTPHKVLVASKYFPLPTRLSARTVAKALDNSLERLGIPTVDLYQVHQPFTLYSQDALMDALAEAVHTGKARAIGVSNYSPRLMERAYKRLELHGIPLASNQVNYSLLKRTPEATGLAQLCRDLGVALIAYSPLAQGVLTGKYAPGAHVGGLRRFTGPFRSLKTSHPVVEACRSIGNIRGKTVAQVALNWLLCRPGTVIPIPGAKNERQASENAGALGWRLSDEECEQLDRLSRPWLK